MAIEFEIIAKISLEDLFKTKPGDPCPDKDCDGTIRELTLTWQKDYLSAEARCGACNDLWTLIEQPSYGDIHGNENQEAEKAPRDLPQGP